MTKVHPSQQKEYRRARCAERKAVLLNMLGGKCVDCGTTEQLQFDHINPRTKSFTIVPCLERKMSILIDEVKKCQLLCIYCHTKKTGIENGQVRHHGGFTMYTTYKCRCDLCRDFVNAYYRIRQRKIYWQKRNQLAR